MKAMILAAGKGTRMLPLTRDCPKPLLPVAGIPLLERWLLKLEAIPTISHIIVNAAYLGEQIAEYIERRNRTHPQSTLITVSLEPEPLETGGAIWRVLEQLDCAPFLLINGDIYSDVALGPWLTTAQSAMANNAPCCDAFFMMVDNPTHNPLGDFELLHSGHIAPKNGDADAVLRQAGCAYTFSGLSLLRPALVRDYPRARPMFALREVFDWAIARRRVYANYYEGYWLDVGTPERLAQLEQRLSASS